MIKITKSTLMPDIPVSLKPAFKENFAPRRIHRSSYTTSKRRNELIKSGVYNDIALYNSRYKKVDIKIALLNLYNNKCAYCEQKVEQFHVEHYRPKQNYCWLAFSWDNLISACSYCNEYKDTKFQISGVAATLQVSLTVLKNINNLSPTYNVLENPDLINPETTDPTGNIQFQPDGNITSANAKFAYTITTCRIHRTYLKDNRRKILEDFRRDLKGAFVDSPTPAEQLIAINTIVTKFKTDAADDRNEFLAFRNFVLNNWLATEIKNAKN